MSATSQKRQRADSPSNSSPLTSTATKRSRHGPDDCSTSSVTSSIPSSSSSHPMASPSTASSTLLSLPSPVQPPLASRIPSYWPRLMERVLAMKQHDSSVAEEIRSSAPREILPAVLATKVLLARWRASNPNFPTIPTPLTGVLDEMRRTRNLYVITPVAVCSSNAKQCRRWPMLPSPIYQPTDPFPQNFAPVTIGVAPLTDSDPCRINVDPHPMDTIPREAEYNDTLQTSHDTFELSDSAKSKVRELYENFHREEMEFALAMAHAKLLVNTNADHRAPRLIQVMAELMDRKHMDELFDIRVSNRSDVMHALNGWYQKYSSAMARADAIFYNCIDSFAILGGVESALWPSRPDWRGAHYPHSVLPINARTTSYHFQSVLQLMHFYERMGVPQWITTSITSDSRFDCVPEGRPYDDGYVEASKQQIGQQLNQPPSVNLPPPHKQVRIQHISNVLQEQLESSSFEDHIGAWSPPVDDDRRELQGAMKALVNPDVNKRIRWNEFNQIFLRILGTAVWSGKGYEENDHSRLLQGPEPWNRERVAPIDCLHAGVLLGLYCPPPLWYDPNSGIIGSNGEDPPPQTPPQPAPLIALKQWTQVDVDGWGNDESDAVVTLAATGKSRGVLGWRFVRSLKPQYDKEGNLVRHARNKASFAFKDSSAAEAFALQFQNEQDREAPSIFHPQDGGNNFINMMSWTVNPWYAEEVYRLQTSNITRGKLMDLAPKFPVDHINKEGSDRSRQVKDVEHTLCYSDLFEYNTFPPVPAAYSVDPHPPRLDRTEITKEAFQRICLAADGTPELSLMDIIRLQRLYIIVSAAHSRATIKGFNCELRQTHDGPYPAILRYLVQKAKSLDIPGCHFTPRAQTLNFQTRESLTMTKSGNIVIMFNTEKDLGHVGELNPHDLMVWEKRVDKLKTQHRGKLTPHEKSVASMDRKVEELVAKRLKEDLDKRQEGRQQGRQQGAGPSK